MSDDLWKIWLTWLSWSGLGKAKWLVVTGGEYYWRRRLVSNFVADPSFKIWIILTIFVALLNFIYRIFTFPVTPIFLCKTAWTTSCSITRETPYLWWYHCQILTDFQNSFTGWFSRKFVTNGYQVPSLVAYVATLPCKTLIAINKLWNRNACIMWQKGFHLYIW